MTEAWTDRSLPLEARVAALVDDLTEAEITDLALSQWAPLMRRGLPAPHYVDSGTGLRGVQGATALPAGISLAASFDPELAQRYGALVGGQARAAGYTVVLGPTVDLAREPRSGRIPEALGEDPELAALIAAAHVRGLQSQRVIAQVKHFAAYVSEQSRTGRGLFWERSDSYDVRIDDATLHDGYLRPFEEAVRAGAWSIMGSYNRVNGRYACQNPDLLGIPRSQWGWQGFYCPDFMFAVRDDQAALDAGLDVAALDGPGGRDKDMVASLPTATIRAHIANVVRALIGSGVADEPPVATSEDVASPPDIELAREAAIAGTVLLANQGATLPLGDDVRSIAVIGPAGEDAFFVGGGSAAVSIDPGRLSTPLQGVIDAAADRRVVHSQGSWGDVPLPAVPAESFTLPDGSAPGVLVSWESDGAPKSEVLSRIDLAVPMERLVGSWPASWATRLTPTESGRHRFSLTFGGEATVRVDGQVVASGDRELEQFFAGPSYPLQWVSELHADHDILIEIDYAIGPGIAIPDMGMGPTLRLGWQPPDGLIEAAAAMAASCDAAVVVVNHASGEGMDRTSLELPGDQDLLIQAVAKVNPRTVVVLNTPGAVLMPWVDDVAAVLQVWYPGEQFGVALGAILFGVAEPGGRLPLTFPRSGEDLPEGRRAVESTEQIRILDEGTAFGYRSPQVVARGAQFAFGHGLGYATLEVQALTSRVDRQGSVVLGMQVANTGSRDGVHIAQAYLEGDQGQRHLVGVGRANIPAFDAAEVTIGVDPRTLMRWSDEAGARLLPEGEHLLRVASSAADPGLEVVVRIVAGAVTSAVVA